MTVTCTVRCGNREYTVLYLYYKLDNDRNHSHLYLLYNHMIKTNSGTHFVMKSDFQQLLNGECIGDNVNTDSK